MNILVEQGAQSQLIECAPDQTVLDALVDANIVVNAVCGGAGICGKCQVMVRDKTGTRWVLACQEKVADGLTVVVEQPRAMVVQQTGVSEPLSGFPVSEGASGFGMSVDIGTTTVVARLYDLSSGECLSTVGRTNPQVVFGADVISRISASMDGKLDAMTARIVEALCEMRRELCAAAGVDVRECVSTAVAGNTVMEHIFAGLSPDSIGVSPFEPASLFGDVREIPGLGKCYLTPCLAGYVGGDITAGLLARGYGARVRARNRGGASLFLDMGTNGEMALQYGNRIATCATAAGPVFEGAGIEFGTPAIPGAISQVGIDNGHVSVKTVGDVSPIGICGTGIVDAVAAMLDAGIVDETGYLLDASELDEPFASLVGEEDGSNVFYLTDDRSLYVTQADVRNVQLAKAAVCAGVYTLLDHFGIGVDMVEDVQIAGGFGAFLSPKSAARIGLFPSQLEDRAQSVGNASVEGASALLVSNYAVNAIGSLVDSCDYIELSTSSAFNGFYVEQMAFEDEA